MGPDKKQTWLWHWTTIVNFNFATSQLYAYLESVQINSIFIIISSLPKRPKLNATTSNRSSSSGSKNFALIHKVVNHMKELHLSGEPRKMTVSEILEECQSQSTGEFFLTKVNLVFKLIFSNKFDQTSPRSSTSRKCQAEMWRDQGHLSFCLSPTNR